MIFGYYIYKPLFSYRRSVHYFTLNSISIGDGYAPENHIKPYKDALILESTIYGLIKLFNYISGLVNIDVGKTKYICNNHAVSN
ncbi:uncharacterized protein T551_02466 [Pneumocystis jirovecii RU7]|uniref:Uncharacterized protein n=1 Tax=Pneumocystis jirovecii (strain RU7) TaxID=1408657 RepID=A0A0W4ZJU3_PNEJ7|nr:uncharacterized protein T551_02466 [Pneumocystis jirovecii RU7]KTW28616.1 hypothetical protein T551_02466 [Pneumocystis jirovecii RU7]